MKKHMYDFKPFSRGRLQRLLYIYEIGYQYRKKPATTRQRSDFYELKAEHDLDNSEVLFLINIIDNFTMKEIRQYLLENNSKKVRVGKRTRVRKRNV